MVGAHTYFDSVGDPYFDEGFDDAGESRLWVCNGCEMGTLEIVYEPAGDSTYYPKRTEN